MKRRKEERSITKEKEMTKRETYKFTAFVSGPMIEYELQGRDFDEIYATGMSLLQGQLKKYEGKVELSKVEVLRHTDLPF